MDGPSDPYTAIRYILKGLDPADVEVAFRRHASLLQAARATPGKGSIALDGKTLRGSFDNFHDRTAVQVLSAFATDTALVLAHVDIAEKSNEIPAAQTLLAELGVADGAVVTLEVDPESGTRGLIGSWCRSVVIDGADDEEDETEDRCGAEGEDTRVRHLLLGRKARARKNAR